MSIFRLVDRGEKETILLIPGWAFDYRIFEPLEINFNYLLPVKYTPIDFAEGVLSAMNKNGLNKISALGWSMGAFLALNFLSKYHDRVDAIILVGAKARYERERLENIKRSLENNRRAFLIKFYKNCFSGDEQDMLGWFRAHLLRSYLDKMSLDLLVDGLDYLLSCRFLMPSCGTDKKIVIVHGRDDKIVDIAEARNLKKDLPDIELVTIEKAGHLPFLTPGWDSVIR